MITRYLLLSLFSSAAALLGTTPQVSPPQRLVFEPNRGQTAAAVEWLARGSGYEVALTHEGMTMLVQDGSIAARSGLPQRLKLKSAPSYSSLQMRLVGGRSWSHLSGLESTGGVSNYVHGAQARNTLTDIPHYARVKVASVYPGIDLVLYGKENNLEYDFVVAPGADPRQIRMAFEGQKAIRVEKASGDLVLTTPSGSVLRQGHLRIYQPVEDRQVQVTGRYQLDKEGRVMFALAAYDRKLPLIIDPTVAFSEILGGADPYRNHANAVAMDSDGNSYFTGGNNTGDLPVKQAFQPSLKPCDEGFLGFDSQRCIGVGDAFVTKLSPSGEIIFSTYFGGNKNDEGLGIAVDATGVYITGSTDSPDFPNKVPGSLSDPRFSYGAGFVSKFSSDGRQLIYSRILSGGNALDARAIAVDSQHAVWVTGTSGYGNVLVGAPPQMSEAAVNGPSDMFYAKFGPAGETLFRGLLGGSSQDVGYGIAIDRDDNAWMTGGTCSPDFPTSPGWQQSVGTCSAFVVKFSGFQRSFSTVFGGSHLGDVGTGIAVDGSDMAYVTGYTRTDKFPTTSGVYQATRVSTGVQAFVTAIDNFGHIVHSTFLGDDGDTYGNGIALDSSRDVYVALATTSRNFPGLGPTAPNPPLGVVVRLSRNLATLAHANYLGTTLTGVAVSPPLYGQSTAMALSGVTEKSAYVAKLYEDGVRDNMVWWNQTTGGVQLWNFNHAYTVTGIQTLGWQCGPQQGCPDQQKVVATGDLNGDGFGDILLHNLTTGQVGAWLLNGEGSIIGVEMLSGTCGASDGCSTNWKIVGIGDFNGDQRPDVLWQNVATGEVQAWLLNQLGGVIGNLTLVWKCGPAEGCPTNWRIVGVGDVNQDGKNDVVLHNVTTGEVQAWLLNTNGGVIGTRTFGFRCDAASGCSNWWSFVGLGDFNRDGFVDLLWYNSTTGDELAVLQDGSGNVRDSRTFSRKCGPSDGCSPAWKPVGTLRDYHITTP